MQNRKGLAVLLAVLLAAGLSACTRQRNMDTAEFCSRFNELRDEQTLMPEQLFKETADVSGAYYCNFAFAEGHTALLTLNAQTDGTVTALQLTCIPEGEGAYTAETFSALYACFVQLVSVLSVCEPIEAQAHLQAAGITEDRLGFSDFGFTASGDGFSYALFSGEKYLSLFCSRTR